MKIPAKYLKNKLSADQLEAAGQLRLAYVLRALIQPIVALVQAVKAALGRKQSSLAPVITESERSITVRLQGALLSLSGDDKAFLDADAVRAEIAGCKSESDAMDVLEGLGFTCRMLGHKAGAIDETLLEDHNDFSFA